jgi:protein ImuA
MAQESTVYLNSIFEDVMSPVSSLSLHPELWRASELARNGLPTLDTGYPVLSAALPDQGWPLGQLMELLQPHPCSGEVGLLRPALSRLKAPIALLQPPYMPNAVAWSAMGIDTARIWWLRGRTAGDLWWAAEQILRSRTCGALLFWQDLANTAQLRRLHLAAQASSTLLCMVRPLACASQPSPAVLRLTLHPAQGGIRLGFLKRRGPQRTVDLFLPLYPQATLYRYAALDLRASAPAGAGSIPAALVS